MEIIEGKVSNYKGHGDIHRFYGKIGEEIKFYFLDFSPLSNGNMIATTELVEAIDSEVPASHIGLVDNEGNVVIPLENKTIKPITGDILLVERLNPLSQNVLDAIEASKDTKLATGLVSITNTCKNKVMEKLGVSSELVFHNQLSEASIFDINGNNLVNNEYYSYIGVNADKVYLGKNLVDAPIAEYSMLPPEIQSNTMVPDNAVVDNNINVEETAENAEEIKDTVDGVMAAQEQVPVEGEVQPTDVIAEETPADVEVPIAAPVENAEVVTDASVEGEVAPAAVEEEVPVEGEAQPTDAVVEETPVVDAPVVENAEVPVVDPSEVQETVGGEVEESQAEIVNNNAGFDSIDIPDVPIVDAPVDLPVVDEAPEEAPVEEPVQEEVVESAPAEEEVSEETTENIINDENVDNVDDVLNSLFGNIANVEEPEEEAPVEEPVQEETQPEEVQPEETQPEEVTPEEVTPEKVQDAVEEEQGEKDTNVVHEGEMMVDFELYDYDDKPHHLNEFVGSGKYTILEFSGLSCGPCHMAKPVLEELYKENKDRFEMITISTDMEKVWKKKPLGEVSWHEWNDHKSAMEITQKYGVMGIPTFFIISPDGKVENKSVGLGEFFEALKNYIPAEKLEKYMKKRKEN